MLHLSFVGLAPHNTFRLPPQQSYQFDGAQLRASNGAVVAVYESNMWTARGQHYTHLIFDGVASVEFKGSAAGTTDGQGTFLNVEVYGNVMRSGDTILASIDGQSLWQGRQNRGMWQAVVMTAAGQ
jgi:hypothetical protein